MERSYRAVLPGGTKCLATLSVAYDPGDLDLLLYESRMTEPLDSTVSRLAGRGSSTASEKAADMAVAHILMPKPQVRGMLRRNATFEEMLKHFGVSKEATRFCIDEVSKEGH